MKNLLLVTLIIICISQNYAQSIGISGGYGMLNMEDVNNNFKNFQIMYAGVESIQEINGGLFLEGNYKYNLNYLNIGLTANYISSSGEMSFIDRLNLYPETLDVSTIELLGLFEIVYPPANTNFQLFIQLGGGIGFASTKRVSYDIILDVSSEYFAGRIKGGAQFNLRNIILELGLGYRIANAGDMQGTLTTGTTGSGEAGTYPNWTIHDTNGNPLKFDYSGLIVTAGVSLIL